MALYRESHTKKAILILASLISSGTAHMTVAGVVSTRCGRHGIRRPNP